MFIWPAPINLYFVEQKMLRTEPLLSGHGGLLDQKITKKYGRRPYGLVMCKNLKWQKESCIAVSLIIPEREIVLIPKA